MVVPVQMINCLSHGCVMWQGRHLSDDEIRALSEVHALIHRQYVTVEIFDGEE